MDTAYLATVLDRIRDTQLQHGQALTNHRQILADHGQVLASVAERQAQILEMLNTPDKKGRKNGALAQWLAFLKPIAYAAALWATALLVIAYIAKGGDLISAVSSLGALL